ncbi:MAG: hypothetical protein IJH63_00620 [Methanobrevibacter sp.]|nr:hypothetical protein [Methanosphaera sp.]MBR0369207.1 hypothetical protein [Methanobrevibacter sp.]
MSDGGAVGVCIHDVAEILSEKYYNCNDEDIVKSHIGFNLVGLKDLVNIIQKEANVNLHLCDNLEDIRFFKNEEQELKYLQEKLNGG